MMFIFGMQMMVQAQYNVFGDQMMPFIFGMASNNCTGINWIIMKMAIYMKLWRVKHENTAWHTALQESDEFEVRDAASHANPFLNLNLRRWRLHDHQSVCAA